MTLDFLIVDPSPAVRRMIHRTLRMGAMQVDHIHEAGDAEQAVRLLDDHWVDGIISVWECWMDEETRLVEWLSSDEVMHEVPTIAITSDGRPETLERIASTQVTDLLVKPFQPEDLYAKAKEIEPHGRE